jgi:YidC/Oxa1 family membrane protein insertase
MDKNTWIGFGLIAVVIIGFSFFNRPSKEELAERRKQDSIQVALQQQQEADKAEVLNTKAEAQINSLKEDSKILDLAEYGPFASSVLGHDTLITLENNLVRLGVTSKGGYLAKAELLEYHSYSDKENPLCLFQPLAEGDENKLNFVLNTAHKQLNTEELYFEPQPRDSRSTLVMRLHTDVEDSYLDFVYTLAENDYRLSMRIEPHNMNKVLAQNVNSLQMYWEQRIPQQEKGRKFEEKYAQLQYMYAGTDGDTEKLDELKADDQKAEADVKWIAHKDQFFATVLIAESVFESAEFESTPADANSRYIKEYKTKASIPFNVKENKPVELSYYLGPNHYNTLKAYDKGKEDEDKLHLNELVPLGWKIVSWINKILVIPMFDLFTSWGLHIGLVILLMTLVIKLILLPFVYASNKSSAKMRVLKPQLDEINAKYPPERMQERQQATMALYQKAGVNPLSGCLPMLFQFPVLMAMFWFLPTAIELRGQSLFWAEDLSTYDAIISWNTPIPIFGTHLSLFCLIMTVVNIIYTHITMQTQSAGQEMKFMKWLMYLMPLMFLFFFNDYAAGLCYYYFLSLLFTIMQTMIFRWTTDDKKILAQLEANAKKTPKKSRFAEKLEAMQREQQRLARERAKEQQKKMR